MVEKKTFRERAKQVTFERLFEVNKLTERNIQEDTLSQLFAPYRSRFPKYMLKKYSRKKLWELTAIRISKLFLEEMLHDILIEQETFEFPNGATLEVKNVVNWKLQKRESHLRVFRPVFTIPYKMYIVRRRPYFVKLYPKWRKIFNERKEEGMYV